MSARNQQTKMFKHVSKDSMTSLRKNKMFAEGKKNISKLGNKAWIADLASRINISTHFSSLNCILQRNYKFYHDLYSYTTAYAFIKKLCL